MENQNKTIAIVFTSLDIGGIERKIVDLSVYYSQQKNINLHLFLKHNRGYFLPQMPSNITIHSFTQSTQPWLNLFFPIWLFGKILTIKPNLLLAFGNFSAICTIIANFFSKRCPVIISEDSSINRQIETDSFSLFRSFLIRLTYPAANGIIVLTNSALAKISHFVSQSKITILPNWLPINIPTPQVSASRPIDILFIGRLTPQKDPLKFLRLCRDIQLKKPGLSVTMIGDGPLKPQVQHYIKRHHLRINLLPGNTPVQPYYQSSKSFVLTSNHEGFPLTILESFYYQTPVICPALAEVKPFFIFEPQKFLYSNHQNALKLITTAINQPLKLKNSTQKYHDYVVTVRDQNFHDTLDYLQQFL